MNHGKRANRLGLWKVTPYVGRGKRACFSIFLLFSVFEFFIFEIFECLSRSHTHTQFYLQSNPFGRSAKYPLLIVSTCPISLKHVSFG